MRILAPTYYKKFQCTADRCTHSCCIGWEIDIDSYTEQRYQGLSGPVGERIRRGIKQGADGAYFALCSDGCCPNLNEQGLCRIILELGEAYLCDICREHPRFYNQVGDHLECGLGAACEAAAALILHEPYDDMCVIPDDGEREAFEGAEFDATARRAALYRLLADPSLSLEERLTQIRERAGVLEMPIGQAWNDLFLSLEYLQSDHRPLFLNVETTDLDKENVDKAVCERFFAYLIYRHASAAQNAREFGRAVGFSEMLTRLFAHLIAKQKLLPVAAAVTLSEEIEYSVENTEAIQNSVRIIE